MRSQHLHRFNLLGDGKKETLRRHFFSTAGTTGVCETNRAFVDWNKWGERAAAAAGKLVA